MSNKLAFYRKYRPSCFKELIGQEFIVKTLQNSIVKDKKNHAYIFSGPRGVGKTSIAKIFSKALNCLDSNNGDCCNKCKNCLLINSSQTTDVIELDAASNNGVNEVRNIIDTIGYVPNSLKTKVYIIDEAHMLSNAAWNAFLKSIEEPPEYLVFIFATTEPHKFPATIISRCQRYNFLKLNNLELKNQLEFITKKEEIKIDNESLNRLILLADGSLRDACSILDQLDSYTNSNITVNDINKVFGLVDISEKLNLIKDIYDVNVENQMKKIEHYENNGANFYQLAMDIIQILFEKLVFNRTQNMNLLKIIPEININFVNFSSDELVKSLEIWQKNLLNIKNTINQKFFFQIACLEMTKLFEINKQNVKLDSLNKANQDIKDITLIQEEAKKQQTNKFVTLNEVMSKVVVENTQPTINKVEPKQEDIKKEVKKEVVVKPKIEQPTKTEPEIIEEEFDEIQENSIPMEDYIDLEALNEFIDEEKIDKSGKDIILDIINKSIFSKQVDEKDLENQKWNQDANKKTTSKKPTKQESSDIELKLSKETKITESKKGTKTEAKATKEKASDEISLFDIEETNVDNSSNFIVDNIQNIENQEPQTENKENDKVTQEIIEIEETNDALVEDDKPKQEPVKEKPKIDTQKVMASIFAHQDKKEQEKVTNLINDIKSKVATNLINANLKDIQNVLAVSKNGIIFLCNDAINANTINNFAQSEDFLNFLKESLNKVYFVLAIQKKDINEFRENNKTPLKKTMIDDVDIEFLKNKIKNKKLAKDIAEEMLKDIIVEE